VSRRDKGTLFLTKEELGWYRDVIDQLLGQFVREGDLSRRSVETMLQDAIFQTLDLANESIVAFDERLATSIAELRTRITAKPVEYVVFVPIDGFAEEDLPLLFGGVRFASVGKAHRRRLKKAGASAAAVLGSARGHQGLGSAVCRGSRHCRGL
jgi:hypothetical protein